MPFHPPEALGKALGVTIVATSSNLRATRNWIPSRVSPLYCTTVSHAPSPFLHQSMTELKEQVEYILQPGTMPHASDGLVHHLDGGARNRAELVKMEVAGALYARQRKGGV